MVDTTKLTHPTYQIIDNESEADALAWVFTDSKLNLQKIAFKFPPLKSNEARARLLYSGLCHSDLHIAADDWGPCVHPIAPGHEIVAEITHVGADVKDFKVGDHVGFGTVRDSCEQCTMCKKGYNQLCTAELEQKYTYGDNYWGGYATSIQHPARFFYKLPEGLPEEKIPPLFCAGITVYAPIARTVKPGDSVAVLGVGGLGHMAVKYAKAMGCSVTAFTSSKDKEEFIKGLGADRVVLSDDETIKSESMKHKLVINTLPVSKDMSGLVGLCQPMGTFCQVGVPPFGKPDHFNFVGMVFWQVNFTGSNTGSQKEIREMLEFSAKHNIIPLCEQFDFEDMPKAFDKLKNGKPIFRCVVDFTKAGIKKDNKEAQNEKDKKDDKNNKDNVSKKKSSRCNVM